MLFFVLGFANERSTSCGELMMPRKIFFEAEKNISKMTDDRNKNPYLGSTFPANEGLGWDPLRSKKFNNLGADVMIASCVGGGYLIRTLQEIVLPAWHWSFVVECHGKGPRIPSHLSEVEH